jgi:hypothetical protein
MLQTSQPPRYQGYVDISYHGLVSSWWPASTYQLVLGNKPSIPRGHVDLSVELHAGHVYLLPLHRQDFGLRIKYIVQRRTLRTALALFWVLTCLRSLVQGAAQVRAATMLQCSHYKGSHGLLHILYHGPRSEYFRLKEERLPQRGTWEQTEAGWKLSSQRPKWKTCLTMGCHYVSSGGNRERFNAPLSHVCT